VSSWPACRRRDGLGRGVSLLCRILTLLRYQHCLYQQPSTPSQSPPSLLGALEYIPEHMHLLSHDFAELLV
jgi:hypothetical protein